MATPDTPEKYRQADWRENLRIVACLMAIWFFVSYGCGILLVDQLNKIEIGGFKFGFWMAQQGSIYVFVVLIFIYVRLMNKLDEKYSFNEKDESKTEDETQEKA